VEITAGLPEGRNIVHQGGMLQISGPPPSPLSQDYSPSGDGGLLLLNQLFHFPILKRVVCQSQLRLR
jgi:hypothetical protein